MTRKEVTAIEVTVTPDMLIGLASLLAALGAIGGVVIWCLKFVQRNDRQDRKLADILKEQALICYGVQACLKGLKEQGCNGPVTEALDKLEKHINAAAHEEDFLKKE